MGEHRLFPSSSTVATLAYCWRQVGRQRRPLMVSWLAITLGTLAQSVAAPLVFAAVLTDVAALGPRASFGREFAPLVAAYAGVLVASTLLWRLAGWMQWGAAVRAFANAATEGYRHLLQLSHRWHTDRPSGEVISTLETFSWSFVQLLDTASWGFLRIVITTSGAIVVLGVMAWPVCLVVVAVIVAFALVLRRRMGKVVTAAKQFSEAHTRATGVIADTIANLTTVRSQAVERLEESHVAALVADSVAADLRARRVFSATRLQMESSLAGFSWLAVVIGILLALDHRAAAGTVYLILFYVQQVVSNLEESFEHLRQASRDLGRCAKFVGIAASAPEIVDAPRAVDLVVAKGRIDFCGVHFAYREGPPLFSGLDLHLAPGEHVGLVGSSGSGKTTLTKLLLRFMDLDAGAILIDDQDIAGVTQHSLRRQIAHVSQDPQLLHRTIAENICYGLGALEEVDLALVEQVGKAAHVDEFVARLPDGYRTVVGERGLKLSGGQRQRVAIAQAMAKAAPILLLDEATSALDSQSESLVQDALWNLMEGVTAIVVAHRLATIARLDRIVVVEHGRIVEQGTHDELLGIDAGVYRRLWQHQSGGFLAA